MKISCIDKKNISMSKKKNLPRNWNDLCCWDSVCTLGPCNEKEKLDKLTSENSKEKYVYERQD